MSEIEKLTNQVIDLSLEIKSKKIELGKLKRELINQMAHEKIRSSKGLVGSVKVVEYKTKYSAYLKKEFNELSDAEKRELYKTGLLNLSFRLNTEKYQEFIKNGKSNLLEKFIRKKNNQYLLTIHINEKSLNILRNQAEDILDISPEVEKILDELDEERYFLEEGKESDEIDYDDPNYLNNFIDDDVENLDDREKRELGLE